METALQPSSYGHEQESPHAYILDVGCGSLKRGDIGVDLSKNPLVDVIADAQHIPFKEEVFDHVVSHHVLEHLPKPEIAIKEMLRVSKGRVRIVCPHKFGHYAKITSDHIHFFNKRWFGELARVLNVKENVRTTFEPAFYFGPVGLFMRPSELIIEYQKRISSTMNKKCIAEEEENRSRDTISADCGEHILVR